VAADLENLITETVSQTPVSSTSGGGYHDGEYSPYRTAVRDSLARLAENAMLMSDRPEHP